MTPQEWTYLAVLIFSIPIGFLFKRGGYREKQLGGAAVGLLLTLVTCNIHTWHSLVTILGTWVILSLSPRSCHYLTLGWTFSYLLFFRTVTFFGLPAPTPFTNAMQLLLTLKMVSLANEVQELSQAKKQDVASFSKGPMVGLIPSVPGLGQILCYSYCYVGLLTGPFYRYRTYLDWLQQPDSRAIPSWHPLLARVRLAPVFGLLFLGVSRLFPLDYVHTEDFPARALPFRLFYMVPVFFVFRMRFYVAWLCAESACIAAAFGAYPTAARARPGGGPTLHCPSAEDGAPGEAPPEYDYETIKNIDPYGTDFCVRVREGMRYWNMTVQWWLAQYIYKSAPFRSYVLRSAWTMLISAYWHGLHPGYYLSFLTIPLCLAAEGAMEAGLRGRRGAAPEPAPEPDRSWGAWLHWFLKMRAYDYMCMGFVLLELGPTLHYWRSIYFCVHGGALALLLLGRALGRPAPRLQGPPAEGLHRE